MNPEVPAVVIEPAPAAEAVAEAVDATVEIARINADRDVTIAAIEAETQQAALEAADDEGDDDWQALLSEFAALRELASAGQLDLSQRLDQMQTQLTAIQGTLDSLLTVELLEQLLSTRRSLSIPPSTSQAEQPMPTETLAPGGAAGPGGGNEEAVPPKRRHRLL